MKQRGFDFNLNSPYRIAHAKGFNTMSKASLARFITEIFKLHIATMSDFKGKTIALSKAKDAVWSWLKNNGYFDAFTTGGKDCAKFWAAKKHLEALDELETLVDKHNEEVADAAAAAAAAANNNNNNYYYNNNNNNAQKYEANDDDEDDKKTVSTTTYITYGIVGIVVILLLFKPFAK
jgi:hypothetical protein